MALRRIGLLSDRSHFGKKVSPGLYTFARFRSLPKSEQSANDAIGLKQLAD